jgi:hypothetical protein
MASNKVRKSQKKSLACSLEVKPTGKESKESKEKGSQSSAAHLVEGLCENVVEKSLEGLCSGVCSMLTGLTAVAINIAYLYTYAS